MKREAQYWFIASVTYILLTFAMSLVPSKLIRPPFWRFGMDWVLHAIEYAILTWIVLRWLQISESIYYPKWSNWNALGVCFIVGGLNEFVQAFTPGRSPSLSDEVANLIGALLMILLFSWFNRNEECKMQNEE